MGSGMQHQDHDRASERKEVFLCKRASMGMGGGAIRGGGTSLFDPRPPLLTNTPAKHVMLSQAIDAPASPLSAAPGATEQPPRRQPDGGGRQSACTPLQTQRWQMPPTVPNTPAVPPSPSRPYLACCLPHLHPYQLVSPRHRSCRREIRLHRVSRRSKAGLLLPSRPRIPVRQSCYRGLVQCTARSR